MSSNLPQMLPSPLLPWEDLSLPHLPRLLRRLWRTSLPLRGRLPRRSTLFMQHCAGETQKVRWPCSRKTRSSLSPEGLSTGRRSTRHTIWPLMQPLPKRSLQRQSVELAERTVTTPG